MLDTNVMLDVYSCHDLFDTANRLGYSAPVNHQDLVHRRARARESLLLAIQMHHHREVSFSLWEAHDQLLKLVPPTSTREFPFDFTTMFLHVVKDVILGEWVAGVPYRRRKVQPTGKAADDEYVRLAKVNKVPLISNEGYTPKGIVRSNKMNIVEKARLAGVKVYTPRQFYETAKRDTGRDIGWFLSRFEREAAAYIAKNPNTRNALETMHGFYRHILEGKTKGQVRPAKLRVY